MDFGVVVILPLFLPYTLLKGVKGSLRFKLYKMLKIAYRARKTFLSDDYLR